MKWINDNLGHKEGDLALSDTAKILKNTFRESEIIGRIGGDEFAVLAVETDDTNTEILYQRLQKSIDEHNATASRRFTVSMSIGMSSYNPLVPCTLEELLSRADNLMYENKKRKKNT
jgi:two-component system, cell cycle response regulator